MPEFSKFDKAHMECANVVSKLSYCFRRKVGALLVSPDNRMLLSGYNGTSPGRRNICEDDKTGETLSIVHHAEANLIGNAAKNGISTKGCKMFITTSPCIQCAKLIEISGIAEVIYKDEYKDTSGIMYLREAGIPVNQLKESV